MSKIITRLLPLLLLILFHSGQAGAQQPNQSPNREPGRRGGHRIFRHHNARRQRGRRTSPPPISPSSIRTAHRPASSTSPAGLCLGRPAVCGAQDVRRAGEGRRPGLRRRARRCDPAQHLCRRHLHVRPQHRQPRARRHVRAQEERRPRRRLDEGAVRARPARRPRRIYKVDGRTGVATLFANVTLDGVPNPGPAWAISPMMPRTSNCSCRTSTPA